PVHCYHGPAIGEDLDVFVAEIDHRFNRNDQSLAKDGARPRLAVIGNLWLFVHGSPDTVPAIVLNHRIPKRLDIRLNGVANIAKPVSYLTFLNRAKERILG